MGALARKYVKEVLTADFNNNLRKLKQRANKIELKDFVCRPNAGSTRAEKIFMVELNEPKEQ